MYMDTLETERRCWNAWGSVCNHSFTIMGGACVWKPNFKLVLHLKRLFIISWNMDIVSITLNTWLSFYTHFVLFKWYRTAYLWILEEILQTRKGFVWKSILCCQSMMISKYSISLVTPCHVEETSWASKRIASIEKTYLCILNKK